MQSDQTDPELGDGTLEELRKAVVEAALPNVVFDGWTDKTLAEAVEDAGVDPKLSRLAFPRGGLDLAIAFHDQCDARLGELMDAGDMSNLRYSEKVARAIEVRLEMLEPHREAVRRAVALFALPTNAAEGARAIWRTTDTIWTVLGDTSEDVNWYTKRATLSGVYSAVVLYWLGDESPNMESTREFIARRIDNVMQFEKAKASFKSSPLGRAFDSGPGRILEKIRKPGQGAPDMPGRWRQ